MRGVERAAMANGDENVVHPMPLADVVMDVVRRNDRDAGPLRERQHRAKTLVVAVDGVMLQLEEELIRAQALAILERDSLGLPALARIQQPCDLAFTASREHAN